MTTELSYHQPISLARRVLKEGTFNARDAGGYPLADGAWLRERHLFRSDALGALTAADIAEFGRLGIATVIDLRDAREADAAPDILDHGAVRYERIPIFEERLFERDLKNFPTLLGQYQIILDEHVHQLVRVLKLVTETSDRPVLVHCTAGKDRTGLILALIHATVGLAQDLILGDYGASEQILGDKFEQRVHALYRAASLPVEILGEVPRHAPPAYLEKTLESMRAKSGSILGFLEQNGFSRAEQQHLARAFISQPAG